VGLPGLEPGTSSLSVPHFPFHSVLACLVIWPFCSILAYIDHLLCLPRTSASPEVEMVWYGARKGRSFTRAPLPSPAALWTLVTSMLSSTVSGGGAPGGFSSEHGLPRTRRPAQEGVENPPATKE
jgi:hypothetical protein